MTPSAFGTSVTNLIQQALLESDIAISGQMDVGTIQIPQTVADEITKKIAWDFITAAVISKVNQEIIRTIADQVIGKLYAEFDEVMQANPAFIQGIMDEVKKQFVA